MQIKIRKLEINGFKLFDSFTKEFLSKNLIVFDGPNGFGKTSFYDAVEFLFTGKLRRYEQLIESTVDKRSSNSDGCPLLHVNFKGTDLIIKAELQVGEKTVFLMRKENAATLKDQSKINKTKLPLYVLKSFDDAEPTPEPNEEEFLEKILGKDHIKNFEYLSYVEQQENIYLLKQQDKDRADAISHLFNTSEFQEKINNLKAAEKKIKKLWDKDVAATIKQLEASIKDQEKALAANQSVPQDYDNMIIWKDVPWDRQEIKSNISNFIDWLREDGELAQISVFLLNQEEFRKDKENRKIDSLLEKRVLIADYLSFWNHFPDEPALSLKVKLREEIEAFLDRFKKGVLDKIDHSSPVISDDLNALFSVEPKIDISIYKQALNHIKEIKQRSTSYALLLAQIKDSRKSFVDKVSPHLNVTSPHGECPLCGYSWKDIEELLDNFISQERHFDYLIAGAGGELNTAVENFEKDVLSPIRSYLTDYLSANPLDVKFIKELQSSAKKKENLLSIDKSLRLLNIDVSNYLQISDPENEESGLNALIAEISGKKVEVNYDNLHPYFETIFIEIFDGKFENTKDLNVTRLADKKKYVSWQLTIARNATVESLKERYAIQKENFERAKNTSVHVKDLVQIYTKSLEDYQKRFIENIEILFHIYYGRIAQETKNSLGLFIRSDGESIRFLEHHTKDTDAVFTMSSGQLATLVIAFTLALNKRFSQNKLLFIDDPVQTLDELNIAGLIELLRNEFGDRQIFLSTHEDKMSAYIRYKFKKFGLEQERISFKEDQLERQQA